MSIKYKQDIERGIADHRTNLSSLSEKNKQFNEQRSKVTAHTVKQYPFTGVVKVPDQYGNNTPLRSNHEWKGSPNNRIADIYNGTKVIVIGRSNKDSHAVHVIVSLKKGKKRQWITGYLYSKFIKFEKYGHSTEYVLDNDITKTGSQPGRISLNKNPQNPKKIYAEAKPGAAVTGKLPYNTLVEVVGKYKFAKKGEWLFIRSLKEGKNSVDIIEGWVQSDFVAYPLPSPGSKLYHVKAGDQLGSVIQKHKEYKEVVKTYNDARLLVNAVVYVNSINKRKGLDYNLQRVKETTFIQRQALNWDEINSIKLFQAVDIKTGHNIWLPSPGLIKELKSSGKITGASIQQKINDFSIKADYVKDAFFQSWDYVGQLLKEKVKGGIWELLFGFAIFAIASALIIGLFTAIGGLVGSAPGAALGFALAVKLIKFAIAVATGYLLYEIGKKFYHAIIKAWNSGGDKKKIKDSAFQFADAFSDGIALILTVLVGLAVVKGSARFFRYLKSTRLGKWVKSLSSEKWRDLKKWFNKEIKSNKKQVIPDIITEPRKFFAKADDLIKDGKKVECDKIDLMGGTKSKVSDNHLNIDLNDKITEGIYGDVSKLSQYIRANSASEIIVSNPQASFIDEALIVLKPSGVMIISGTFKNPFFRRPFFTKSYNLKPEVLEKYNVELISELGPVHDKLKHIHFTVTDGGPIESSSIRSFVIRKK